MNPLHAIASGAAGAVTLTLAHQAASATLEDAPRVDIVAERALAAGYRAAGQVPPPRAQLHRMALAGDLVSNSLYYSLVGVGDPRHALRRGAILGFLGGLGAALLPPVLGLGKNPVQRTPQTIAMTVAWYTLGGLAAATTQMVLSGGSDD